MKLDINKVTKKYIDKYWSKSHIKKQSYESENEAFSHDRFDGYILTEAIVESINESACGCSDKHNEIR